MLWSACDSKSASEGADFSDKYRVALLILYPVVSGGGFAGGQEEQCSAPRWLRDVATSSNDCAWLFVVKEVTHFLSNILFSRNGISKFKHLPFGGKMEREMERWFVAVNVVMQALYCTVKGKKELSCTVKFSIYRRHCTGCVSVLYSAFCTTPSTTAFVWRAARLRTAGVARPTRFKNSHNIS